MLNIHQLFLTSQFFKDGSFFIRWRKTDVFVKYNDRGRFIIYFTLRTFVVWEKKSKFSSWVWICQWFVKSDYEKASYPQIQCWWLPRSTKQIETFRLKGNEFPVKKEKKFVKRRHCVSACISFLLTSLSKQSSWSQDVSAMSNQGRRKVWKSEQVLMKCWTVLTGTPVAFKTWCGHQYRVGIICLLWLRYIGLRWLPKLGVDTSSRPHAHRRACKSLTL